MRVLSLALLAASAIGSVSIGSASAMPFGNPALHRTAWFRTFASCATGLAGATTPIAGATVIAVAYRGSRAYGYNRGYGYGYRRGPSVGIGVGPVGIGVRTW